MKPYHRTTGPPWFHQRRSLSENRPTSATLRVHEDDKKGIGVGKLLSSIIQSRWGPPRHLLSRMLPRMLQLSTYQPQTAEPEITILSTQKNNC